MMSLGHEVAHHLTASGPLQDHWPTEAELDYCRRLQATWRKLPLLSGPDNAPDRSVCRHPADDAPTFPVWKPRERRTNHRTN